MMMKIRKLKEGYIIKAINEKEDEYIVDGSAKLDVISELIGINMESEEFDSVGGLLIGELGRFPEQNEEITLNNIKFTVEEIDKNRVKKVRIFT